MKTRPCLKRAVSYCTVLFKHPQLRALCIETVLEKRKKEKVCLSVSVPFVKGDRMGTWLRGLQGM